MPTAPQPLIESPITTETITKGRHSAPTSPAPAGTHSSYSVGQGRRSRPSSALRASRSTVPPSPFGAPEVQNQPVIPEPVKPGQLIASFGGRVQKPTPKDKGAPVPQVVARPAGPTPESQQGQQPGPGDGALDEANKFKPTLPHLKCAPARGGNKGDATCVSPPSSSSLASTPHSPSSGGAAKKTAGDKLATKDARDSSLAGVNLVKPGWGTRNPLRKLLLCFGA